MLNKSPAFQFYPQDYLSSSSVAEMSLEEEGAYIRLLCYCWTVGSIPADPERCARLAGKGCTIAISTVVQRAFNGTSTDPQRLVHPRLEKEREKQLLHKQRASIAGKKSAVSRAASRDVKATKNGRSTERQRKVKSSSSSSDEDDFDTQSQVDQFGQFWAVCPKRVAIERARKAWIKATTIEKPDQIIDAMRVYAKSVVGKEPQYIAHPATWLNGQQWKDEPVKTKKDPFAYLDLPEAEQEALIRQEMFSP